MEIDENSSVEDIISACPESLDIFKKLGLQVFVCGEPVWEKLGELCEKKGINTKEAAAELKKACS